LIVWEKCQWNDFEVISGFREWETQGGGSRLRRGRKEQRILDWEHCLGMVMMKYQPEGKKMSFGHLVMVIALDCLITILMTMSIMNEVLGGKNTPQRPFDLTSSYYCS
jgi:hypothetical protein